MLTRLELPCPCGDAFPIAEGGGGACPRCGARPSEHALRAIPPRSAFRVWHIALASAATCAAVGFSSFTYWLQVHSYRKCFQDLGLTLPRLTNLLMHSELVVSVFGALAASAVFVFLLARQQTRRGLGVGPWPGRALFCLLLLSLVLETVIAKALYRPWIGLLGAHLR